MTWKVYGKIPERHLKHYAFSLIMKEENINKALLIVMFLLFVAMFILFIKLMVTGTWKHRTCCRGLKYSLSFLHCISFIKSYSKYLGAHGQWKRSLSLWLLHISASPLAKAWNYQVSQETFITLGCNSMPMQTISRIMLGRWYISSLTWLRHKESKAFMTFHIKESIEKCKKCRNIYIKA